MVHSAIRSGPALSNQRPTQLVQHRFTAQRLLIGLALFCILPGAPMHAQQPVLNWDEVHYTGTGTNTGKRVVLGDADDVYVLGEDGVFDAYLARYRSYDGQPQWLVQWDSVTKAVDLVRGADGTLYAVWVRYNEPLNSPLDIGVGAWSNTGVPLWTYYWNDSLDRDDVVKDLHLDPNGNLVLCATTEELPGNPSVFNNISVLKLDPAGNLLWRRTWSGATNGDDEPGALTCDASGGIYVTGYTTNPGIAGQDLLLLKYNASGALQWTYSINRNPGAGAHVDIGTHVVAHGNGLIMVAGITESPGAANLSDISVYAFSAAGDIQWPLHYNNQAEESVLDLEEGPDGDLFLLGRYGATAGDGEVVLRITEFGALLWEGTYATAGLDDRYPSALAVAPNGHVITTGTVGDQLLRDAYARAYDEDGTPVWTYRYTATNSMIKEEGHDVTVGANGAIYVTGMYDQNGQPFIKGLTFCLCPAQDGVCLLAPDVRPAFPVTAMAGLDLDQDGWRDLVFGLPLQNALGVYMNGPSGFTLSFPVSMPAEPTLLATGDLDQDGDQDVVAGNFGGADLHTVLNNSGALTFASTLAIGGGVLDLAVADLDGQNGPDVIAVKNAAPYLVVLLNNGSGSFATTTPTAVVDPYRVAVGDANMDGFPDLLLGRFVNDDIHLLLGNGAGAFSSPVAHTSGLTGTALVGIGDLDRDGINDLVTCNGTNTWAMRPGLGGGAFGPAITGNVGPVDRFLIAPFPQDSSLSLIAGNAGATRQVRFSDCSITYNATDLWGTAAGNHLIDVADWSNDGSPDLLSFYTQGEIRIWRNCDTLGVVTAVADIVPAQPDGLILFPVPAADRVTVLAPDAASEPAEVIVRGARGEVVRRMSVQGAGADLHVQGLSPGVYVAEWQTRNGRWTGRLLVAPR